MASQPQQQGRRHWMRGGAALAVALAVNAAVLAALASLNQVRDAPHDLPEASLVFTELPPLPPPRPEPDQPLEPDEPIEPEPLEVTLDAPLPDAPAPEPIELDLSVHTPTPDPIRVSTRRTATSADAQQANRAAQRAPVATGLSEQPGNPQPSYPRQARRRGIEGTVQVRFVIDTRGRVEQAEILNGHPLLRNAVAAIVDRYRFDPPQQDGQPVRAVGVKTFHFKLEN